MLVHGGTSGIGTMAIALGDLFGLRIIVTCGSDEKCRRAEALGAAHAINYNERGFRRRGGAAHRRARASMSSSTWSAATICRATWIAWPRTAATSRSRSSAARRRRSTSPSHGRRLTLTGSTLRPRSVAFKSLVADEIARSVWPHVEEGRLKPVIDAHLPAGRGRRRAPPDGSGRPCRQDRADDEVMGISWLWREVYFGPWRRIGVDARWEEEHKMTETLILHEYAASGNCYKIRLTAALLGLPLERRDYDIMKGETRTADFLAEVNANGRIPVLQVGERFIPESNAACFYLADGSALIPDDRFDAGGHAALDVLRAI